MSTSLYIVVRHSGQEGQRQRVMVSKHKTIYRANRRAKSLMMARSAKGFFEDRFSVMKTA